MSSSDTLRTLGSIPAGNRVKRLFLLLLTLLAGCVSVPLASVETGLPTVPGAFDPAVTQDNIHQTICASGWSKTRRPPVTYTNKIKFALMAAAGVPRASASQYELDTLNRPRGEMRRGHGQANVTGSTAG